MDNIHPDFIEVLDVLRSHKYCSLFESRLPSQEENPKSRYTKQIKQHMDLQIIQNKLEQGVYSHMRLASFFRDLLLMFNNAMVFYPKDTLQYSAAFELKAIVVKEMGKKPLFRREIVIALPAIRNPMLAKQKLEKKMRNKARGDEGKDDIGSVNSQKFNKIMKEIESSHNEVKNPREQIADAETLFDLAKTLVSSVRSHSTDGITLNMFISSLLGVFGTRSPKRHSRGENTLSWKKIGRSVSPFFSNGIRGFHTMIGPMDREVKQRKYTRKPRSKLYLRAQPKELDVNAEEITDTDKNISTMFQILRKKKRVKLEKIVLNRTSFAQSIENLFALSFLVKDGRVVIDVDENGAHFLTPRNGPAANLVKSGEVKYSHFVFRLDFADWELMKEAVAEGEELMPNREIAASPVFAAANKPDKDISMNPVYTEAYKLVPVDGSRLRLRVTRVKTLSTNHGEVIREGSDVDTSPESGNGRRLKRKLL
ncbi:non-structural maintenance of chromosomes element 4 homolog A-like [Solanum pennellii]|uniref:Non-structural maintenance of chromosomes element 4 n=1 Tax=Solanum pennellii TaxID=28526 RepID=A0ABM1V258_SOLPN|nr:non-structural maintenance of chromosomes element 4 homolog A-like [Solanum pennellii]